MRSRAELLTAYDDQLRTEAETPSAVSVRLLGPLRLATFARGRGFVTYRDLGDATSETVAALVATGLAHFRDDPEITSVEWKTRGHDHAPGLTESLLQQGFVAEETESIMIGDIGAVPTEAPLPAGVTVRRIVAEADVRAMAAMQNTVFGDPVTDTTGQAELDRLAVGDGMQLWVAEHAGEMISAGRLEPVRDRDFAGLWGGATVEAWRGQGIYRAVTAARIRAAAILGKTLVHSDSTEFSRPILERAGFVKVSTTTPYRWRRGPGSH